MYCTLYIYWTPHNIQYTHITVQCIAWKALKKMFCKKHSLNLDPNSELWANLDPEPGLCYECWEKISNNFREKTIFLSKNIFLNYSTSTYKKVSVLSQLSLWKVNICLYSYTFCFYFISYFHLLIRIRIPNKDPDPQRSWIRIQYGSNPDPQFTGKKWKMWWTVVISTEVSRKGTSQLRS